MSGSATERSASTVDPAARPNVLVIVADDMGFSDLGCFGSEIRTPNLDALAAGGVMMSQFYNTARCSPARASMLTGLHPHQTGVAVLTNDDGPGGYPGRLNDRCVTMAEILRDAGYSTAMRGKWHLTGRMAEADDSWPTRRGFDTVYGPLGGSTDYYRPRFLVRDEDAIDPDGLDEDFYLTDSLGDEAVAVVAGQAGETEPFFLYLPFTAPHFPLHAPEEVVARYRGVFDAGWDELRRRRYERLVEAELITGRWPLSERDENVVPFDEVADRDWQVRRMEVYAAQVELMDAAIGRVIDTLRDTGQRDNTLILFLSDNGGCAEELAPAWVDEFPTQPYWMHQRTRDGARTRCGNDTSVIPGGPASYASYGKPWANLSNTPFREYKHWVHEGGIATPLIAHWPAGGLRPGINHDPHQLTDILPTVLEATGADYPASFRSNDILPVEGVSMLGPWRGRAARRRPLFFEHEGNCAIRDGRWKLVRKYTLDWELYDLENDRTELHDLADVHPERVTTMAGQWQAWADRCGVLPRDQVLAATGEGPATFGSTYVSTRPAR